MNKESNLNNKEIIEIPDQVENNFVPDKSQAEVELLVIKRTGKVWPHYGGKKALSASTLTKILREIEYEEIPEYILLKAAERGKNFHDTIQNFIQSGDCPSFVNLTETKQLNKLEKRIHETVNFLKKNKFLKLTNFLSSEKLHHIFYKNELLATYVDLEFNDYIVELKTSNIKANGSPLALLIFEIQLLIQHLCTGKSVYLLWSTGEGIIFEEFKSTPHSLKTLDMLIELVRQGDTYSPQMKKAIIQKILNNYSSPKKLITSI
ncbi:MAG: hypothetical protein I3274_05555 [Candidatus Moeniiplasma glomeromycotorum]|nr:hypothetical protein [Candidatus Moeniiplasma glomeromycotorum]